MALHADPRYRHDAYITWNGRLYEVIGLERRAVVDDDGPLVETLHVRNCQTLHSLWLTLDEADRSQLVRDPTPPTVPIDWRPASAPSRAQGGLT